MKDLFSALLAPFFVIVNVVALFFLLAACPVVIAVAAIAAIVALPFVLLLNFFEADRWGGNDRKRKSRPARRNRVRSSATNS